MNCTGKQCIMQFDKVDPSTCKCVSYCPQATPPKTNADKLRSMTDEELAAFLVLTMTCSACRDMHGGKCPKQQGKMEKCSEMILGWLKQEADDGV